MKQRKTDNKKQTEYQEPFLADESARAPAPSDGIPAEDNGFFSVPDDISEMENDPFSILPDGIPEAVSDSAFLSPDGISEMKNDPFSVLPDSIPEAVSDPASLSPNGDGTILPNMNRCFKDGVFRLVFREKESLLSLYNAVSGTCHDDPGELAVYTLEDAVYMGIKNDLGFLLHTRLALYEHQSTLCENMPLRGLQYFAGMYRSYVKLNGYDPLRRKRIPLPLPQYIVFYNGTENSRERWELKLSDAFMAPEGQKTAHPSPLPVPDGPALECRALVLNINEGKNRELMEKCGKLKEYAQFVSSMRRHMKGQSTEGGRLAAVNAAVDECIRRGILKEILIKNRAEVVAMSFWEYDAEHHLKAEKEDSYGDGFQAGIEQEKGNTLREKERADAAENRADAAERELRKLREELRRLRGESAGSN